MGSELTVATIRIAAPDSNRCWASNSSTHRSRRPEVPHRRSLAFNVNLPPLFIVTCGDDFLEADNLALAAALARKGADFELFDPKPRRHETLGHVFVIGMPWLDESVECFERCAGSRTSAAESRMPARDHA